MEIKLKSYLGSKSIGAKIYKTKYWEANKLLGKQRVIEDHARASIKIMLAEIS